MTFTDGLFINPVIGRKKRVILKMRSFWLLTKSLSRITTLKTGGHGHLKDGDALPGHVRPFITPLSERILAVLISSSDGIMPALEIIILLMRLRNFLSSFRIWALFLFFTSFFFCRQCQSVENEKPVLTTGPCMWNFPEPESEKCWLKEKCPRQSNATGSGQGDLVL